MGTTTSRDVSNDGKSVDDPVAERSLQLAAWDVVDSADIEAVERSDNSSSPVVPTRSHPPAEPMPIASQHSTDTHSGYGSDNNSSEVIENSYLGDHDDFEINVMASPVATVDLRAEPSRKESVTHEDLHDNSISVICEEEEENLTPGSQASFTADPSTPQDDEPPAITRQPKDELGICPGSNVSFSIEATGSSPKAHAWERSKNTFRDQKWKKIAGQAACNALQHHFDELARGVRTEEIAPELFSKKIITQSTMDKIRPETPGDCQSKMELLMFDVLRRVQAQYTLFHCICEILEKANVSCVEDIRAEYRQATERQEGWGTLDDHDRLRGSAASTMIISSVLHQDEGSYRCKASNRAGVRISQPAVLTVSAELCATKGHGNSTIPTEQSVSSFIGPTSHYDSELGSMALCSCGSRSSLQNCDNMGLPLQSVASPIAVSYPQSMDCDSSVTGTGYRLHQACEDLNWEAFCECPRTFADVTVKNEAGKTPLHLLVDMDLQDGSSQASVQYKMIQQLLEHGPAVCIADQEGNHPLHFACAHGATEIARLLLKKYGADTAVENNEGETALHLVCRGNHPSIVELLVSHDPSSIDARSMAGNTPLHLAALIGNTTIVNELLRPLASHEHQRIIKPNKDLNTPLHLATERGQTEVVRILLEHCCSSSALVNQQNKNGDTALHIACRKESREMVRILVQHGAEQGHVNGERKTPLELVPSENREAIMLGVHVSSTGRGRKLFKNPWKRKKRK